MVARADTMPDESVNLAGEWVLSGPGVEAREVVVPGRVPRDAGSRFDLERRFPVPANLEGQRAGLFIGTAATFLEIEINGRRITDTLSAQQTFVEFPENAPRLYPIPPGLLSSTEPNELVVRVIRSYGGPGGILAGPVLIGPLENLRSLAVSAEWILTLVEAGLLAFVAFGVVLVLLLAVRTGGNATLAGFVVFSALILVALACESLLLHSLGWKSEVVVRMGWAAFGLVAPALLAFLSLFLGVRVGGIRIGVFAAGAVTALLILILPDPALLAVPFTIISVGAFFLSVPMVIRAAREGRPEAVPTAAGLCGFLFFGLLGMAELVGVTQLPFPPIAQKTILFLQLALLTLYLFMLLALCESFLASQKTMRKLAGEVLTARDRERERVGRDLHDRLGQTLQGALLLTRGAGTQQPARLEAVLHEALAELREISEDLHPHILNLLPLGEVLKSFLDERRGEVPFEIIHQIDFNEQLDDFVTSHLFSVFLEAFQNAIRHSKASRVEVRFYRRHHRVILEIADDGIGQQRTGAGSGLGYQTMRERMNLLGGSVEWRPRDGGGLVVHAELPMPRQPAP